MIRFIRVGVLHSQRKGVLGPFIDALELSTVTAVVLPDVSRSPNDVHYIQLECVARMIEPAFRHGSLDKAIVPNMVKV